MIYIEKDQVAELRELLPELLVNRGRADSYFSSNIYINESIKDPSFFDRLFRKPRCIAVLCPISFSEHLPLGAGFTVHIYEKRYNQLLVDKLSSIGYIRFITC